MARRSEEFFLSQSAVPRLEWAQGKQLSDISRTFLFGHAEHLGWVDFPELTSMPQNARCSLDSYNRLPGTIKLCLDYCGFMRVL
jgi:hypothetical protein